MDWTTVFTSAEFLSRIPSIILLITAVAILCKILGIKIRTEHIQIGGESRETYYERTIVREQTRAAKGFIHALEQKCNDLIEGELPYGGYKTKYVLELVYDCVVDWITYNHLENSEAYINCKCNEIDSIIYQSKPLEPFKTPEFQERVHRWVKEVIEQMIAVRTVYKKQMEMRR